MARQWPSEDGALSLHFDVWTLAEMALLLFFVLWLPPPGGVGRLLLIAEFVRRQKMVLPLPQRCRGVVAMRDGIHRHGACTEIRRLYRPNPRRGRQGRAAAR